MDEPDPMRRVDGIGHVAHEPHLLLEPQLARDGVQGAPLDQLHRDVRTPLLEAGLVDAADALVLDARLGSRLLQQPGGEARVVSLDELQGDVAPQRRVVGLVHGAHAAGAEELKLAEAAEGAMDGGAAAGGHVRVEPSGLVEAGIVHAVLAHCTV